MINLQNLKEDITQKLALIGSAADPELQMIRDSLQFCSDDITFIIEEMVDDFVAENELFFQFAYALRKKDPAQKYTSLFLSRVKPRVLYDIVASNVWSPELNRFVPLEGKAFTMTIGQEVSFQY